MQLIAYKHCARQRCNGFTLIETLVVVAVIALLSSVITVSVSQAMANARDATRKAHLDQIVTAIEQRFLDTSTYALPDTGYDGGSPSAPTVPDGIGDGGGWFNICNNSGVPGGYPGECMDQLLVDEGYLTDVVHDPLVPRNMTYGASNHRPYMRYCNTWRCNMNNPRLMCMTASLEKPSDADRAKLDNSGLPSSLVTALKDNYDQNYAVCSGGL